MSTKFIFIPFLLVLSLHMTSCLGTKSGHIQDISSNPSDLLQSISQGNVERFKEIIENNKLELCAQLHDGATPLHLAVQVGGEEGMLIVKYLIEECEVNPAITDKVGYTALQIATFLWELDILKYLIERGGDKNIKHEDGITLLHFAALEGDTECVKYLVEECKLDVSAQDKDGGLPLHYAASNGNIDCMLYLIKKLQDNGQDRLLHKQGGELNYTPLHCLVSSEKLEEDPDKLRSVIQALAESKDKKDCKGRAPKDLAINRPAVYNLL